MPKTEHFAKIVQYFEHFCAKFPTPTYEWYKPKYFILKFSLFQIIELQSMKNQKCEIQHTGRPK